MARRKYIPLPNPPPGLTSDERIRWYQVAAESRRETQRVNAGVTRIKGKGGDYCRICKGPHVYKHGRK